MIRQEGLDRTNAGAMPMGTLTARSRPSPPGTALHFPALAGAGLSAHPGVRKSHFLRSQL